MSRVNTLPRNTVAALALLVWDYFITLKSEVSLVWPSKWGAVKFLFFLTRYLAFVDVSCILYMRLKPFITVHECTNAFKVAGWLMLVGIVTAEVILLIRTWAIWDRSRSVGIFLTVALSCCVIAVIYIEATYLNSVIFISDTFNGCFVLQGNAIIGFDFVIIIIYESLVLAFTLIRGIGHYRRYGGGQGCFAVLYRDGILFYGCLLGISIINLAVGIIASSYLANGLVALQRVGHSVLSARVLINLRQACEVDTSITSGASLSICRFENFALGQLETERSDNDEESTTRISSA